MKHLVAVAFISLTSTIGLRPLAESTAPWTVALVAEPSPAAPDSAQPHLSVNEGRAVLSWIERSGTRATLKLAQRTARGWSESLTVASGDNWFVNWADVPSVVAAGNSTLVAHWLQKSALSTYAYDIKLSRSVDGGKTWSAPVSPHHDGTPTEHGFVSMFPGFPAASGAFGLVWLDGRAMKGESHNRDHAGAMSLRGGMFDAAGTQTSEVVVDNRVCECCPTAAASTSDGPIVAFRDRSGDEVRDIYVARLVDGMWTTPAAVHHDNWKIAACPVNGPSLSARGREVAVAWYTMQQDLGHAYVAFSRDAGRTFGAPVRVDERASLGRVDVELLADGSAAVAWIEASDGGAQFRLRRVGADATPSAALAVADISATRASGYPRMAVVDRDLLFAWTDTAQSPARVQTAVARLP